jgi:Na+-driven multidrug efflux pump
VYMNIFTVMLLGLNTGVVTLVSQTFGYGNLRLCGTYINRGRVVVFLAYFPAAFMLALAQVFFKICHIDPTASSHASTFILTSLPSLFL